jgi:branched-chain amino acid transport system substrate-binding protein
MRAERRAAGAVLLLALVAAIACGCSGEKDAVRIGVLTECTGLFATTNDNIRAGAALALLERGGARTADGGASADVGGRPVELVPACTELTYLHLLILATRRLVEEDDVDVVVGPIGGAESVTFRKLAARYPDVTFVAAYGAQEATLRDPRENLFRVTPDGAQTSAGLGTHAFRELGWRRAVVVGEPFDPSWELAAGFVAEFCALGGNVVERDWSTLYLPDASEAARRHAREADGVVLVPAVTPPVPYLTAYAKAASPVAKRLLLSSPVFLDQRSVAVKGIDLSGVVIGGYIPLGGGGERMKSFRSSYAARFPDHPIAPVQEAFVIPVYTAVAAVTAALDEIDGELGDGQSKLRAALAARPFDAPWGTIRLDGHRQASGPTYLERIEVGANGNVTARPVRTLRRVEQTYGGIFTGSTTPPSVSTPACERRPPPRWAR